MTLDAHQICIASGNSWCWGTCADLQTDESNCGSCGTKCLSGEACSKGKCLSWTGTWLINPGADSITLVQSGKTVLFGTGSGSSMFLISGTTSGNPPKLIGTWEITGSGGQSGTLEFSMSADGKTLSGWTTHTGTAGKTMVTGTRQ
jgi:hypothetical protein